MEKGNVLVIGNSGVGKSTLINAVLGDNVAKTGFGTSGTTKELKIFENDDVPFRLIDTVGFEPSFIKQYQAINAVRKWSSKSATKESSNSINLIWFCIDGTSSKLFPDALKSLSRAISIWKSVPIIVVITKSYSIPDRKLNIDMIKDAFSKQKKLENNLRKIIPVVADTYVLNDTTYVSPDGINELIDATIELMPEGVKASEFDIYNFKLGRKKALSQSVVGAATTSATIVGAIPIPIPDAVILTPVEIAEINAIASIYEINRDEKAKKLINSIVEVGTVSQVAKTTIVAIKAIPGLNIAASVLNAIVAGCFAAVIGEGSIHIFEQIYLGKKSIDDIDWVKKIMEDNISSKLIDKVNTVINNIGNSSDKKTIQKSIKELYK